MITSRRKALASIAAAGLAFRGSARAMSAVYNGIPSTAGAQAAAIRSGKITAKEIAQQVIVSAEAAAHLGIFISFSPEQLLEAAQIADEKVARKQDLGPLHGVPIPLKDNIDVLGYPTSGGTPALRNHLPSKNATVSQRLLDAGALIAGKANMHELAGGGTTNNPAFKRSRNPYDPARIPGGSSGGSAVAVAARVVPAAIGTDTAGSVCNPAGYCGIVGFRPSMGRYPSDGIVPLALTRDTAGPFSLTVEDTILIDQILANRNQKAAPVKLRDLRIGIPKTPFQENMTTDVKDVFFRSISLLEDNSVTLIEAEIPDLVEHVEASGLITLGARLQNDIKSYLEYSGATATFDDITEQLADPFLRSWLTPFFNPTVDMMNEYAFVTTNIIPSMRSNFTNYLKENALDAILFPTTPIEAGIEVEGTDDLVIGNQTLDGGIWLNIQNTAPATLWGGPGISLPAGITSDGLPVGLELNGAIDGDPHLLSVAAALETLLPPIAPPDLG